MAEGNNEFGTPPQETQVGEKRAISPGKFGRLRTMVKEQQAAAQARFKKDSNIDAPESAFLGIAVDKVRSDLGGEYDKKTGLRNHESFKNEADREIAKVNRNPELHGLMIAEADVDKFGVFNSTYGELTGDKALRAVATAINGAVRDTDLTGRWGGEEFAIVMPFDKDAENAPSDFKFVRQTEDLDRTSQGERIRQAVADIPTSEDIPEKLTTSVGLTEYVPGETFESAFERASLANLIAKLTGKNRSVTAKIDPNGDWLFHAEIPGEDGERIYEVTKSFDGKKLIHVFDRTNNEHFNVTYVDNKKPTLVPIQNG